MAIKDARCNVPACPACAAKDAEIERLRTALSDMLSGWKYIRAMHGDLHGVGWDRAQRKAERALRGDYGGCCGMTDRLLSPETCIWQENEDGDWETECGERHILIDGTPDKNGMCFCCYCGQELVQSLYYADD